MANHKSAKKAHEKSVQKRTKNQSFLSSIRTIIKKVENLLLAGKSEEAAVVVREAESHLMKGVTKGVLKKNTASRKVSNLTKKVKGTKAVAPVKTKAVVKAKATTAKAKSIAKKATATKAKSKSKSKSKK